jgi:MYXO-CTERM domain-containing protein
MTLEIYYAGAGAGSSSGTLSNFSYTAVPAPGALALLGAAGLAGARRRR